MQCVNCGRLLPAAVMPNGVCPSCGTPSAQSVPPAMEPPAPPVVAPSAPPEPAPVLASPTPPAITAAPAPATPPAQSGWAPPTVSDATPLGAPPVPPAMPAAPIYPAGYTAPQQPAPPYPYPTAPGAAEYPPSTPYPPSGYPPAGYPPSGYPPTGYPPMGYPAPTLAPVAKKGANGLAIGLSVGAIVVVLALLGSLVFLGRGGVGPLSGLANSQTPLPTATATIVPSPTPLSVPAPAPGFSTFKADDGSYGLNYPSDWRTVSEKANGITEVIFGSSSGTDIFLIVPFNFTIPHNGYQQIAESFAKGTKGTNIKFSAAPTPTLIGANSWTKETGSFTFEGTPVSCNVLGLDRTAGTFLVIYFSPKAHFSATETSDYTPMLQSLTFLKGDATE